jgi:hypothetical protein
LSSVFFNRLSTVPNNKKHWREFLFLSKMVKASNKDKALSFELLNIIKSQKIKKITTGSFRQTKICFCRIVYVPKKL